MKYNLQTCYAVLLACKKTSKCVLSLEKTVVECYENRWNIPN